jgi:hypothetical protein
VTEPPVQTGTTEQELRHNTLNEVTGGIHLVTSADGTRLVRKRLSPPGEPDPSRPERWRASEDPRAYSWWRREADVYGDTELRDRVEQAGLGIQPARIELGDPDGLVLWLDWAEGRTAADLTLDDHVALATGLGRWQARGPLDRPWTSRAFLRSYAGANFAAARADGAAGMVYDEATWRHPLIAEHWPADLQRRWQALLADADRLFDLMEALPRTLCHLDVWAMNVVRRADGVPVLLDWAFTGDGAIGEDVGNAIPDACFDLLWPAERVRELDAAVTAAYTDGLRQAGWREDPRLARLGIVAACVKYIWLVPWMLHRVADDEHRAYFHDADSIQLYRARGMVFSMLTDWHDEALALSAELGLT